MAIKYYEQNQIFKLDTKNSTYLIRILKNESNQELEGGNPGEIEQFVEHLYYGRRLTTLSGYDKAATADSRESKERAGFQLSFPKEYPTRGFGEQKEEALAIRTPGGHTAVALNYISHRIYAGKKGIKGLPATFGGGDTCDTLELHCKDAVAGLEITLKYSVFQDTDAIVRSTEIVNRGQEALWLTKAYSAAIDLDNRGYDVITVAGDWAREGQVNRYPLTYGQHGVASVMGKTGPCFQPFLALASHSATQEQGEVIAMNFVYSGNFIAQASMDMPDLVRMVIGIHSTDFNWKLEPQEAFHTPEAVLVYSAEGIGGMTRSFHDLYRKHLIRSPYKDKERPILINNWEATYFNFTTEKLIAIAKEASRLGIEMLVMDDGWFGYRNDDNTSLGDWFVNEEKLPGGLNYLVSEVNKLGMKFGIWFEPEMVCPDSDLYRAHPDWAIALPGRTPGRRRNQYVLDLTRSEVVDAVYKMISDILHSANIEYVKWDMNRALCDLGSLGLPADRMGELSHRYVMGVYELQERLITEFPNLLLENCSSGGARFDPGMLYYSPQIWTSDDTDAGERLSIQEGVSMIYPLSTMGAHISDCPNHLTGRTIPFETRGYVALAGTFGYELDVTRIPEEDRKMIPEQVAMYHKYNHLVRGGDYYRLAAYSQNHSYDCYMVVSKDKSEALLTYVRVISRLAEHPNCVRLQGLDPQKSYQVSGQERCFTGEELMYAGLKIAIPWASGDYKGTLIHIIEQK